MRDVSPLAWATKKTFPGHVEDMRDGATAADHGATRLADGTFCFPTGTAREAAAGRATVASFKGNVRFTGHFGMLDVTIADPAIVRAGNDLILTIADEDLPGGKRELVALEPKHPFADPDSAHAAASIEFAARLTRDGAELLFDNYAPGTLFDPLFIAAAAFGKAGVTEAPKEGRT